MVTFPIKYTAIVFRPFKGEVLDAVVTTVNKLGFFAQVGPLQIFVSKHLIPADMQFDPQSNPAAYVSQVSAATPQRLVKDSEVRLKVIGTRIDATEIFAIGAPGSRTEQPSSSHRNIRAIEHTARRAPSAQEPNPAPRPRAGTMKEPYLGLLGAE